MKKLGIAAAVVFVLAACGGGGGGGGTPYQGFVQPANTVAVNFTADDTTNKVFLSGELLWKGSMIYDPATRMITYDGAWTGGTGGHDWPPLYDDGPWDRLNTTTNAPGHEPKGSTAGDHKWGVTVFVDNTATQGFEYGLVDVVFGPDPGYGWIWKGDNGTFQVTAGSKTEITAQGITFDAFGTTDMKLVIDINDLLAKDPAWDTSVITVKGSAWTWTPVPVYDDGTHGDDVASDGKYTFVLSNFVGAGNEFYHTGLLKSGDQPEFVYVFNGLEYKDLAAQGSPAVSQGVTAFVKPAGALDWASVPITLTTGTFINTRITVP